MVSVKNDLQEGLRILPRPLSIYDLLRSTCSFPEVLEASGLIAEKPMAVPEQLLLWKIADRMRGLLEPPSTEPELCEVINFPLIGGFKGAPVLLYVGKVPSRNPKPPPMEAVRAAAATAFQMGCQQALIVHADRSTLRWSGWSVDADSRWATVLEQQASRAVNQIAGIPPGPPNDLCRGCSREAACAELYPHRGPLVIEPPPGAPPKAYREPFVEAYLDRKIKAREKPRPATRRGSIYPSEIGYSSCDRRLAYSFLGRERTPQFPPSLLRIFLAGSAIHDTIQEALGLARGAEYQVEQPVREETLRISGRVDGIYRGILEEYKGISPTKFAKLRVPLQEHRLQVSVYGALLGVEHARFLYVCRETGNVKEFPYKVEPRLWDRVASRIDRVKKTVEMGNLPPPTSAKRECAECPYVFCEKRSL